MWTHTQVARTFTLRVYLGEVGQADLVVAHAHEALIDEALFAAAQAAPRQRPSRSPNADFHLRGLIRCAGCGFPMTGWNQPRVRASGAVDRVRVYRCVRQRSGGACQHRAVVMADTVETLVRAEVEPYVRHFSRDGAWQWTFSVPGRTRVDFFSVGCDTRYAALGSSSARRFGSLERLFRRAAESLQPRC